VFHPNGAVVLCGPKITKAVLALSSNGTIVNKKKNYETQILELRDYSQ